MFHQINISKRYKAYGNELNSHDLFKFAALFLMTIDHIGAYLLPQHEWLRVIGRGSFPIWFFLSGYHRSVKIGSLIVIYGIIMVGVNGYTGYRVFPVNALFSMIFCRMFILFLERKGASFTMKNLWVIFGSLIIWQLPLMILFEYGALALNLALLGYLARLYKDGEIHDLNKVRTFAVFTTLFYMVVQVYDFSFGLLQTLSASLIVIATITVLMRFKLEKYNNISPEKPLVVTIKALSRYSLEYYLIHRVLLQILSVYLLEGHDITFKWYQ